MTIALALALLTSTPAHAYVYWGNPQLTVQITRPEADLGGGEVELHGIRVHPCSGGYTEYLAEETIDPVEGWQTTITGGDLCEVEVRWDSDGTVWNDDFTLESTQVVASIDLSGTTQSTAWSLFSVISGSFTGNAPLVTVTIE